MSVLASPWQVAIHARLLERDATEKMYEPIIRDYNRLSSTLLQQQQQYELMLLPPAASATNTTKGSAKESAKLNLVLSDLATTRALLAEQYRLQSSQSNRTRALAEALSETAREKATGDIMRRENEVLRERGRWFDEVVREKEKQFVLLQDEHQNLSLELHQLSLQNNDLRTDNAKLLERWMALKNEEARKLNEVNHWVQEKEKEREREMEKGKGKGKGKEI